MGFYINSNSKGEGAPVLGKVNFLIKDGATPIPIPVKWSDDLVCVVNNGPFDAAAYAYSEVEMKHFRDTQDMRPKIWLKYPYAAQLSGFLDR